MVGATAAAFGGESIAHRIAPELERIEWIGPRASAVSLALVIASISYLSIVLGELVPKSLALRSAETFALQVGRIVLALSYVAKPIVWLLGASANLVLRPFGDQTTFTETRYSAEELQELVEDSQKGGMLDPEVAVIAARALEFPELTAADVMVPRREIVSIPLSASLAELRNVLHERPHTRLPVYEGSLDNVVGYVNARDMLAKALNGEPVEIPALMREAYFVPESKQAVELLNEMRARRVPFAIVVDEQGGTSGLASIEDLLEEIVGDISSEHSREEPQTIKKQPDGSTVVSGLAHVRDVNRELGIELPEEGPWTTIAGLCLSVAGHIPVTGETLAIAGYTLEVTDASQRRIRTVRIPARVAATATA